MGRAQFAIIRDSACVLFIKWLLPSTYPHQRLWLGSNHKFKSMLKQCLRGLGVADLKITLGSLRAGGTTHLFVSGVSIGRIRYQGRWASEQSLNVYVQEAMASLVWGTLSQEQNVFFAKLLADGEPFWLTPPPVHWSRFFSRDSQWLRPSTSWRQERLGV